MFQNITQGTSISILYRNIPRVADGRVIAVNTHMPQFNPQQPMAMMNGPVTDITVQVGNETIPFQGLPANGVVANFPDKNLFIAIDKAAVLREVDTATSSLEQDLASVPAKQQMLEGYKQLRIDLDPAMRKEAQQAEEMNALRSDFAEMKRMFLAYLEQNKKQE